MSRFVELLRSRKMTMIVSLPHNEPELAQAALEAGADVLKMHINVVHHASGTHFGSLAEEGDGLKKILALAGKRGCPCGIVPGAAPVIREPEIRELAALGFDFISAYGHHLAPGVLGLSEVARMVAPDYTYSQSEMAALGELPVDVVEASVIPPDGYGLPLSVRDLLGYRKIVEWTGKPVVVPTQRAIQPEDIAALAEVGVKAIMIGAVVTGETAGAVAGATRRFRRAVDALNC